VLSLPMRLLAAIVLLLDCAGVWAASGSVFDVWLLAGFGLLGWALTRAGLDPTPVLLGFVLGGPLEEAMRRALVLARDDRSVFVTELASTALLAAAAMVTALAAWRRSLARRGASGGGLAPLMPGGSAARWPGRAGLIFINANDSQLHY
jgi:TctA family transporter